MQALYDDGAMTTEQLCQFTELTPHQIQDLIQTGILKAELVSKPGGGRHREFAADQVQRALVLKALHLKGISLSRLARADLAFDGQAYVVYDGSELRGCRDAAAAIATVVRAKRPCSAVDLTAIRTVT